MHGAHGSPVPALWVVWGAPSPSPAASGWMAEEMAAAPAAVHAATVSYPELAAAETLVMAWPDETEAATEDTASPALFTPAAAAL